ncbi:MAG: SMI1/KNR4 family protein [Planctomycetaceae bacterium]
MPFPVDVRWITETEQKLGVHFPASFVTAMVRMNGGTVDAGFDRFELFPFLDGTDRKRLQRTCGSIDRETISSRKSSNVFPRDGVAIGENGGGDLLLMIPLPEHPDTLQHTVYWWDHETGQIEIVADDFGDLQKM